MCINTTSLGRLAVKLSEPEENPSPSPRPLHRPHPHHTETSEG